MQTNQIKSKKTFKLKNALTFNQNGRILFEGVSPLTGEKIVCIITGLKTSTSNEKTGDMLQTWILLQDIPPNIAHKNGLNRGVCGDCPHTGGENGQNSCYVKWFQAPLQVWKSYKNNRYDYFKKSDLELIKNRSLRLGSAGDPTVIPLSVWKPLLDVCKNHTGYTHQWKVYPEYGSLCMASVDNAKERNEARSLGLRTFRVRRENQRINKKMEFVCPASEEGSKKTTCEKCGLCNGLESKTNKSPVIIAHGSFAVNF